MLATAIPVVYAGGDAFPPNWSQFVPDLINAGITATLVALVVWRLQVRREDRTARQSALDDWNRQKGFLKPFFEQDLEMLPQIVFSVDPAFQLHQELDRYPVEDWARVLPDHQAVQALALVEQAWPRLVQSQRNVRGLLPSALRDATPSGQMWDGQREGSLTALALLRIRGVAFDDQVNYVSLRQLGLAPQEIDAWIDGSLDRPDLAVALVELRHRFEVAHGAYEVVRAAVTA